MRIQLQTCRISMFAARQLRENCTPVGCSDWAKMLRVHPHNERQMTCELLCAIRCDWVSTVFSLSSTPVLSQVFLEQTLSTYCTTRLARRSAAHDMPRHNMPRHDTKPLLNFALTAFWLKHRNMDCNQTFVGGLVCCRTVLVWLMNLYI